MVSNLINVTNKVFPVFDSLYYLQLTNYDTKIFLTKANYFYTRRNLQIRDRLVFTTKIKLILGIYFAVLIIIVVLFKFWVILVLLFTPYIIAFINLFLQKATLNHEDRKLLKLDLKNKPNLQTILITGSQGKTTLKYILYNAVKSFRRTQIIPDNINTTSGVINWLTKNLLANTELLIFETEPFYKGEMTKIITSINPRFRIITNLTDQHLMRFGSLQKLHSAYIEIAQNSHNSLVFTCEDIPTLDHSPTTDTHFIPPTESDLKITNETNNPSYIASYIALSKRILEELKVDKKFQNYSPDWLQNLPQRRKNIIQLWGHEVIDDSYNISLESAKSSIKFALKYASNKDKKLIIITAGIPESSANPIDANIEYGQYLRPIVEDNLINVILLQSEFYPHIKNQLATYQSAKNLSQIPNLLNNYNPNLYTVLFLPELNDFYY